MKLRVKKLHLWPDMYSFWFYFLNYDFSTKNEYFKLGSFLSFRSTPESFISGLFSLYFILNIPYAHTPEIIAKRSIFKF